MKPISITAAVVSAAAALLIPAGAGADTLPKDAVKCTYTVPRSYPLAAVKRKGLPVTVTCEGDATVSSLVDMLGKPAQDWDDAHPHGIPGIALPEDTKVSANKPAVTHVRITKKAAKFLSRYHRPRLRVLVGELMPEGYYTSIDSGKRVVLR
jgi:hypothetical protein